MAKRRGPSGRARHTVGEYFMAGIGVALIVLFVAIAASGSCRLKRPFSPDTPPPTAVP